MSQVLSTHKCSLRSPDNGMQFRIAILTLSIRVTILQHLKRIVAQNTPTKNASPLLLDSFF
jgi:hypothetical protein